jgi:hypothetical protein
MPLYTFLHNLLNVLVQIANEMGLQKNIHARQFVAMVKPNCITDMTHNTKYKMFEFIYFQFYSLFCAPSHLNYEWMFSTR